MLRTICVCRRRTCLRSARSSNRQPSGVESSFSWARRHTARSPKPFSQRKSAESGVSAGIFPISESGGAVWIEAAGTVIPNRLRSVGWTIRWEAAFSSSDTSTPVTSLASLPWLLPKPPAKRVFELSRARLYRGLCSDTPLKITLKLAGLCLVPISRAFQEHPTRPIRGKSASCMG